VQTNIQVVIRVKPVDPGCPRTVNLPSCNGISFNEKGYDENVSEDQEYHFQFARTYGEATTQSRIFDDQIRPLYKSILTGVNCCVMCYGRTGSGKSYTMFGKKSAAGLLSRFMHTLFTKIDSSNEVSVAAFQIYQNALYDLLDVSVDKKSTKKATIMGDDKGTLSIVGVKEKTITNAKHGCDLLKVAENNRNTAATSLNSTSSRSHCVVVVTVKTEDTRSQVYFTDLAGSEPYYVSAAAEQNSGAPPQVNFIFT